MMNRIGNQYFHSRQSALRNTEKILKKTIEDSREKFVKDDLSTVKKETSEDVAIARKIESLKSYEQMVIAHERKHMQIGGSIASAPTYVYTYGPDGRKYISGGNVSMRVPKAGSAGEMIENLDRVVAAALAPSNPSPQDIQTASMASAKKASVESEYKVKMAREAYRKQKDLKQEIKESKKKGLETLDRLIEESYENPLSKIKIEMKMSFEMMI